jgi:cytochrome c-type biogenesis protein CcmH
MRRWLPIVALGILVGILGVALLRPDVALTPADRAEALAAQLRCPDCQGLSVADSPTRSAQEMRRQIDELVGAGGTDGEVRDHFVARYGEWILLSPSSPLTWVVPFVVLLAAALALGTWLLRGRPGSGAERSATTAEERRRVRDEVEALDA